MALYILAVVLGYALGILGIYIFRHAKKEINSILGGTLALVGSMMVSLGVTLIICKQMILPYLGG